MINVTDIGSWPWNKKGDPGLVGMKCNEAGYIVDDPDSTVRYQTIVVRRDTTYTFMLNAEYDNFTDELEALSNHQAYANMDYEVVFRQPIDAYLQYCVRNAIPACGRVPTPPTPSLSPASFRSASSTSLASIFSTVDLEPDTPATQLSFNSNEVSAIPPCPVDPDFDAFKAILDAAHARKDLSIPV